MDRQTGCLQKETGITTARSLPFDDAGLRYAACTGAEAPELARMLARTFAESDPPAVAVGLTPHEFEPFVALLLAAEATRQLTVVARDAETGELAGALLAEDAATVPSDEMAALSVKFDPIFGIFGELDESQAQPPTHEPGAILHLFLLGVDGRYTGRGVAQRLVGTALAHGAALGYRVAVTEATNRTSQHIFRKAGFRTQAVTSYADYRHDGVAVFEAIADQGGPAAMVRELEARGR